MIPSDCFAPSTSTSTSNLDGSVKMDDENVDRVSYEEENAFLQSEREDREKEREQEKGKEHEKDERNSDSDSVENDLQEPCSERGSNRIQRNSGLEFSLYLDETSTADLYLQLISGVQKEKFNNEIIIEETITKNCNYLINDNNDGIKNKNSDDDKNNDSYDSDNNKSTKKAKLENIFPFSIDKNLPKKRKIIESIPTHTIFDLIENKNENKNETKKLSEISSSENKNDFYSSKFLDKETHVRLCGMYEQCKGESLESLVLSDNMLMLMGYPGCDGEEGTCYIFFILLFLLFSLI